jgi:hypothetical protein
VAIKFELKSDYISQLPNFRGLDKEDVYFFLKEFNEVYQMMKVPYLFMDAIKLRYISFALKDAAKR